MVKSGGVSSNKHLVGQICMYLFLKPGAKEKRDLKIYIEKGKVFLSQSQNPELGRGREDSTKKLKKKTGQRERKERNITKKKLNDKRQPRKNICNSNHRRLIFLTYN